MSDPTAGKKKRERDADLRLIHGGVGGGSGSLAGVGGGGDSGNWATRDYVDARVTELSADIRDARNDLGGRIDKLPTWRQLAWTVAGIVVAGAIATITGVGVLLDRFESGLATGAQLGEEARKNRDAIERVEKRLDRWDEEGKAKRRPAK